MASYALHRQPPPDGDGWPVREATLKLRINHTFSPTHASRSVSGMATVTGAEPHLRALVGQEIYFSLTPRKGAGLPERSATVDAIGLLKPVSQNSPAGTWDRSLDQRGYHFQLTLGRMAAVSRPATPYQRFCDRMAERMNALLGTGLGRRPVLAAIYRAMMLGQKRDLGAAQERLFLRSGTMHLFAINGVHIGVVALSLHALFAMARVPSAGAAGLVLAILWLDVDATGASPSAVRAFLMVAAFEAGRMLRRQANPVASLSAAAMATALLAPMDIFTASFQMSYGVVAALCTLGFPLAARLLRRFPPYPNIPECARRRAQRYRAFLQRHLLAGAGVGAAAGLVGGVTGVAFFGLLAPVGLVANLALMPLAFLVITAGVSSLTAGFAGTAGIGLAAGMLSQSSRLFNCAAGIVIWAIAALVGVFTRIPGAYFAAHYRAGWIGPAALAAVLATCLAGYAADWRPRCGGFWPPFVVVAITLVLGVSYSP
jgi:competence protein ComEC